MALRHWWREHRLQLALAAITSTLAVVLVGKVGFRMLGHRHVGSATNQRSRHYQTIP